MSESRVQTASPAGINLPDLSGQSTALTVPVVPQTTSDEVLAPLMAAPSVARQTMSCKNILLLRWPEQFEEARAEAATEYGKMLNNTPEVMHYGEEVFEPYNSIARRILKEFEDDASIPALDAIVNNLCDTFDSLRHNYDLNDPQVKKDFESYQKAKGLLTKIFRRGSRWMHKFRTDISETSEKIDKADDQLAESSDRLEVITTRQDDVIKAASDEVPKVLYKIAAMEMIREICVAESKKIVVSDDDLGNQDREKKAAIEELGTQLSSKINDFLTRLAVANMTGPQVRAMRSTNWKLIIKIQSTRKSTLYVMRMQMGLWLSNARAAMAALQIKAAADATNRVIDGFAQDLAVSLPESARSSVTSDIKPETLETMANGIRSAYLGIRDSIVECRAQEAAIRESLIKSQQIVSEGQRAVSDAFLDELVTGAVKLASTADTELAALQAEISDPSA